MMNDASKPKDEISPTIRYFIAKADNEPNLDNLRRLAFDYVQNNNAFTKPENPADQYFLQAMSNGIVGGRMQMNAEASYEAEAIEYVRNSGYCKSTRENVTSNNRHDSQSSLAKNTAGFFNNHIRKEIGIAVAAGFTVGMMIYSMSNK